MHSAFLESTFLDGHCQPSVATVSDGWPPRRHHQRQSRTDALRKKDNRRRSLASLLVGRRFRESDPRKAQPRRDCRCNSPTACGGLAARDGRCCATTGWAEAAMLDAASRIKAEREPTRSRYQSLCLGRRTSSRQGWLLADHPKLTVMHSAGSLSRQPRFSRL